MDQLLFKNMLFTNKNLGNTADSTSKQILQRSYEISFFFLSDRHFYFGRLEVADREDVAGFRV
jgi:hypothetical protein